MITHAPISRAKVVRNGLSSGRFSSSNPQPMQKRNASLLDIYKILQNV